MVDVLVAPAEIASFPQPVQLLVGGQPVQALPDVSIIGGKPHPPAGIHGREDVGPPEGIADLLPEGGCFSIEAELGLEKPPLEQRPSRGGQCLGDEVPWHARVYSLYLIHLVEMAIRGDDELDAVVAHNCGMERIASLKGRVSPMHLQA